MPTGVAAWFQTCHVDAPTTIVTYALDGKRTTRTMQAHRRQIEAEDFFMAPDGTPLLVGSAGGKFAIAHTRADGTWQVTTSAYRTVALVAATLDGRGTVWSITLTTGPDGKDLYRLMRGVDLVPLVAPDGRSLAPGGLAFDAALGVVVEGYVRDGTMESVYPRWLYAENPPQARHFRCRDVIHATTLERCACFRCCWCLLVRPSLSPMRCRHRRPVPTARWA